MAEKVSITVVVNGQPTQVDAAPNASVQSLVEPALRQTGNLAGQPPDAWELRTADGRTVQPSEKVSEFLGQNLFLNLKAGVGG